jgi:hypothetical protein
MIPVRDTADGATFAVKVHPRAKREGIAGELGEALKLTVAAPPVEGRANEACVRLLAQALGVPRSSVTVVAGGSGRQKLIRIAGMSAEELRARLKRL